MKWVVALLIGTCFLLVTFLGGLYVSERTLSPVVPKLIEDGYYGEWKGTINISAESSWHKTFDLNWGDVISYEIIVTTGESVDVYLMGSGGYLMYVKTHKPLFIVEASKRNTLHFSCVWNVTERDTYSIVVQAADKDANIYYSIKTAPERTLMRIYGMYEGAITMSLPKGESFRMGFKLKRGDILSYNITVLSGSSIDVHLFDTEGYYYYTQQHDFFPYIDEGSESNTRMFCCNFTILTDGTYVVVIEPSLAQGGDSTIFYRIGATRGKTLSLTSFAIPTVATFCSFFVIAYFIYHLRHEKSRWLERFSTRIARLKKLIFCLSVLEIIRFLAVELLLYVPIAGSDVLLSVLRTQYMEVTFFFAGLVLLIELFNSIMKHHNIFKKYTENNGSKEAQQQLRRLRWINLTIIATFAVGCEIVLESCTLKFFTGSNIMIFTVILLTLIITFIVYSFWDCLRGFAKDIEQNLSKEDKDIVLRLGGRLYEFSGFFVLCGSAVTYPLLVILLLMDWFSTRQSKRKMKKPQEKSREVKGPKVLAQVLGKGISDYKTSFTFYWLTFSFIPILLEWRILHTEYPKPFFTRVILLIPIFYLTIVLRQGWVSNQKVRYAAPIISIGVFLSFFSYYLAPLLYPNLVPMITVLRPHLPERVVIAMIGATFLVHVAVSNARAIYEQYWQSIKRKIGDEAKLVNEFIEKIFS